MTRKLLAISLCCLTACGPDISKATCPPETALTYDNFGKAFFSNYCVRCHGAHHGHSSRAFTDVELIRADRSRIFANATGPNPPMPPGPNDPSVDERKKLEEWLVCGAR